MFKKTLLIGCTTLLMAWAVPASADEILFDPDGAGLLADAMTISTFDMATGNGIALNVSVQSTAPHSFTAIYQANLAEATGPTEDFDNGELGQYYTVVAGFGETLTSSTVVGGVGLLTFQ